MSEFALSPHNLVVWRMLSYLFERDSEEGLRLSAREVIGPDGAPRILRCYRIVWRWFDYLVAYEYGPDAAELIKTAAELAAREQATLDEALGHAVAEHLYMMEKWGADVTDDDVDLIARLRDALNDVREGLGTNPFGH